MSTAVRRRRIGLAIGGALLLTLVVLALLAIPLLGVRADAETARTELVAAADALRDGDVETAAERITKARSSADDADERANGFGADVWRLVPVAGGAVADMRNLVSALDDATAVAEIGVEVYASVSGEDATLFQDERIDLPTLATVLDAVEAAAPRLRDAEAALEAVDGTTPFVGEAVSDARADALERVAPVADTLDVLESLVPVLPDALGASGERRYVVAMLNQAEMRYSGGTPLALSIMTARDGAIDLVQRADISLGGQYQWKAVRGNNRFHRDGPQRLGNATFAPSWSVSGEELLRAWKAATGQRAHGVVAVDVEALARLIKITGPLEIPGYGRFTGDNLVERLIGSYDRYTPEEHDAMNATLIPAFHDRLFSNDELVEKLQSLKASADGRHFALYFRDRDFQDAIKDIGLGGQLAPSEEGPLGVFTQNTVASKVDFWHRHTLTYDIKLSEDGTATGHMTLRVHNDTPPYADEGQDPREGYRTRWANMTVAFFMPKGAEVPRATVQGRELVPHVGKFRGRSFFYRHMMLRPGATGEVTADFRLPDAVTVADDGTLSYRLTLEPHPLVNPQTVRVSVRLPEGYAATSLPEGWSRTGDGELKYSVDALDETPSWEIVAAPR